MSSPSHTLSLLRILLTHSYCTDLQFAAPLSVGAFIKWSLARLVNDQGGRGFLGWEAYKDFKNAEKGILRVMNYLNVRVVLIALSFPGTARGFQPKSCTMYLIARLPSGNGRLLYVRSLPTSLASSSMLMEGRLYRASLLSLFSSIAAHSGKNGMPPRRLASLFSPYIFGLVDDQNFDQTYDEWQRATDATEHIILSYVRFIAFRSPVSTC